MNAPITQPLGPVFLDVVGQALDDEDRRRLSHPLVGGVILFARNYRSPEQLRELTGEIRALRDPRLLIAVDHEGGRVQRFRSGYSLLPPMAALGQLWERDAKAARDTARAVGQVIAAELSASGVDFSFTPVLDLAYGSSAVIGDRAFHRDPQVVAELAGAVIEGLAARGVCGVGKHFPGHGFASEDSHVAIPVDRRSLRAIEAQDLMPYRLLIPRGLAAVMPAHVIYPAVDPMPAGFSARWLRDILRGELRFDGVIFSDDLSMEGAAVAGNVVARASAALGAGCDMVLLCNRPQAADELLNGLWWNRSPLFSARMATLYGRASNAQLADLRTDPEWLGATASIARYLTA
ncbi:MAG TPA: beta-N-acetylhexosaminidase [Burkholderiales bacterium]|nr:beta-N-acetylhexosaminidase [Burkholderiales bacterium]